MKTKIQPIIESAFEQRNHLTPETASSEIKTAVKDTITLLDNGSVRVAEKNGGQWIVNQWVKKAVLLSFILQRNRPMIAGEFAFFDKVEARMKNANYKCEQTPFGYFLDIDVKAPGISQARIFKDI